MNWSQKIDTLSQLNRSDFGVAETHSISATGLLTLGEKLLESFTNTSFDFCKEGVKNHQTHRHPEEKWRSIDELHFESGKVVLVLDRDPNEYPFAQLTFDDHTVLKFESDPIQYPHTTLMVSKVTVWATNHPATDKWIQWILKELK